MSTQFNLQQGLIIIQAELWGPAGSVILRLALDTGATSTVVNIGLLVAVGYDPALAPERIQITTGSGVEFVPRVTVSRMITLQQERSDFPVLGHTLPPSAGIDGLLGLDFFRGQIVTLDFQSGQITLS
jgi:predicted aspartyl protease